MRIIVTRVEWIPCHCEWCPAGRCWWWRGHGLRGWPWCLTWSTQPGEHHVITKLVERGSKYYFIKIANIFSVGRELHVLLLHSSALLTWLHLNNKLGLNVQKHEKEWTFFLEKVFTLLSYLLLRKVWLKTRILPRRNKELSIQNAYWTLIQDQRENINANLIQPEWRMEAHLSENTVLLWTTTFKRSYTHSSIYLVAPQVPDAACEGCVPSLGDGHVGDCAQELRRQSSGS